MRPDRPLLTIAIPTYNRSRYLAQSLEVLVPQLANETRVELIISDNASTDDTPEVVRRFQREGLPIRYVRNSRNIGPDANFLNCYEMAAGEYAWILGDDDLVLRGGLSAVLELAESGRFDLIYLRSAGFSGESPPSNLKARIRGDRTAYDSLGFALRTGVLLTFISGIICRKAAIEAQPHRDFHELNGLLLIQLGWVFTLLERNSRCLYVRDILLAGRMDNSAGYGPARVFCENLSTITAMYLGNSPKLARAVIHSSLMHWFPSTLLKIRLTRTHNFAAEDAHGLLRQRFGANWRYWLFVEPVFRMPLSVARRWVFLQRVLWRLDRAWGWPLQR